MIYLANAFSLGMLPPRKSKVEVRPITVNHVRFRLRNFPWTSIIGHPATAQILSELLETPIPYNRQAIQLNLDDEVIVFQIAVRLPARAELSETEVKEIVEKGLWDFRLVKVVEMGD